MVPVRAVTVQVPLAAVFPLTPAIVTVEPVTRPRLVLVVMTIGDALVAPVIVADVPDRLDCAVICGVRFVFEGLL